MRSEPLIGVLVLALAPACVGTRVGVEGQATVAALATGTTLGVTTRAPSPDEGQTYKLERDTRWQGRVVEAVEAVEPGGPAERAGICTGDVLVQVGEVVLYSQDDLSDFLRVARVGDRVGVRVKRKDDAREEDLSAILGPRTAPAGFRWQYASLGQLPAALMEAEKTRKSVLIGLSGAET